jgi:hypothetical protein
MRDRADPHAREHALGNARSGPPPKVSPADAPLVFLVKFAAA